MQKNSGSCAIEERGYNTSDSRKILDAQRFSFQPCPNNERDYLKFRKKTI